MSLREELVQVAAVAVAIITDLDTGKTSTDSAWDRTFTGLREQRVFVDVMKERQFQDLKWGMQHHPIAEWLVILGEEYGEACKSALDDVIFPEKS